MCCLKMNYKAWISEIILYNNSTSISEIIFYTNIIPQTKVDSR
jgi:hypothetical protein